MLKIIGIVLLLLTGLGAIYFHLFVWSTRRPGQGWPG